VLVDADSLEDNLGSVALDYFELSPSTSYKIRYEFFEKDRLLGHEAEDSLSTAHVSCD